MIYEAVIVSELLFLFLLSKQLTRSLSYFLYTLKFNQTWSTIVIAILFLPGTIVHELSHWIMAKILFVPTGRMSLLPKLMGSTILMGSVSIAKVDRIRSLLIGIAPFITGSFIILSSFFFILPNIHSLGYWVICLFVYLLFVITNSMFSSKKDLEGSIIFISICMLLFSLLYFFDRHLLQQIQMILFLIPQDTLLFAIYSLAIPLALDIGIIIVLRLLIRIL